MTQTIDAVEADRALKSRHSAMWALGDYPAVATEVIPDLGPLLVAACGIAKGDRVLDVAAGSGNAAIPAALLGAQVVASDLTPELLDTGRALSADRGAELEWRMADAEALPFADGQFDVVMSCVGVMFAPHHQPAADELVRVCRPGGRIGVLSWTPEGFIGQLFATMRPYAPPPPAGAQPPPLWGDEDHVRELLGGKVSDLQLQRATLPITRFPRTEDFRTFFKACYGPTIAAYRGLADAPGRRPFRTARNPEPPRGVLPEDPRKDIVSRDRFEEDDRSGQPLEHSILAKDLLGGLGSRQQFVEQLRSYGRHGLVLSEGSRPLQPLATYGTNFLTRPYAYAYMPTSGAGIVRRHSAARPVSSGPTSGPTSRPWSPRSWRAGRPTPRTCRW